MDEIFGMKKTRLEDLLLQKIREVKKKMAEEIVKIVCEEIKKLNGEIIKILDRTDEEFIHYEIVVRDNRGQRAIVSVNEELCFAPTFYPIYYLGDEE